MKNYLVLVGHKGYVGSEVFRELKEAKFNVVTLERGESIKKYVSDLYGVVNCAGWGGDSSIDDVAKDLEKCNNDNFKLVENINDHLVKAKVNAPFITISTGCIYTNLKGAHVDTEPNNINPYTRSKLQAENSISYKNTLILRPRLIFSDKVTNRNPLYKIVNYDEVFDSKESATCLYDLVRHIKEALTIMKKNPLPQKFISHCVSRGNVNWAEVAAVMQQKGMKQDFVALNPMFFLGKTTFRRSSVVLLDNLLEGTSMFPSNPQDKAINMLDSLKANMSIQ